jgi:hypothetical protein
MSMPMTGQKIECIRSAGNLALVVLKLNYFLDYVREE